MVLANARSNTVLACVQNGSSMLLKNVDETHRKVRISGSGTRQPQRPIKFWNFVERDG